jgi:hypothetical protein
MTIERKTVYVDNDGTEHSSLQAAATADLRQRIVDIALNEDMGDDVIRAAEFYASHPGDLRRALDSYFEALGECMPEENVKYKPFKAQEPDKGKPEHVPFEDFELTDRAHSFTKNRNTTVEDWIQQGWTLEGMQKAGLLGHGLRGFEMVVPAGTEMPKAADPNDPTTWRVEDLPVDHPSYCRPFGTRGA